MTAAAMPRPTVQRFVSAGQAAAALTARVVVDLERAVGQRGRASLAVSGGTTPAPFLRLLGYRQLDWRRVGVTLTDDRWVPAAHERSNESMVQRSLGQHGRPYRWYPLFRAGMPAERAVSRVEHETGSLGWPLDVIVLGMGEDGHVASLFPASDAGLEEPDSRRFVAVKGPGDEPRISLTLTALREARAVYLLLNGERKLAVLDAALQDPALPIARVMAARREPVIAFAGP